MPSAIGIDLGTTYSCVGVWQDGKVKIIPDARGNIKIPSYVAFTKRERLVGEVAKSQAASNPRNTIYNAKRLIGLQLDDPKIQSDIQQWPFRLVREDGKPKIQVETAGRTSRFFPEQISSMVLEEMRKMAETHLGHKVEEAVITVPAYFKESQRRATQESGAKAGLKVLRIMNNPSAAALAYKVEAKIKNKRTILVFDFGGGTLDVSILSLSEDSSVRVLSTAGDTYLGGENFDNHLVQYFCNWFARRFNKNLYNDPQAMTRLKRATERAKCTLSSEMEATICIKALHKGLDFEKKISRERFETLCYTLLASTLTPVRKALEDASMDKSSIDEIVLVGGSNKIPKVRTLLQDFFGGKSLNSSIDPDMAVAHGAAIQAAILTRENNESFLRPNIRLFEVAPISLGVESPQDLVTNVIKRNSGIPSKTLKTFTTTVDNQRALSIQIYEGENPTTKGNTLLGTFEVTGIPAVPKGSFTIETTFECDCNGFLCVYAKHTPYRCFYEVAKPNVARRQDPGKLTRMLTDDEVRSKLLSQAWIPARLRLEAHVLDVIEKVRHSENNFSPELKNQIFRLCRETLLWIDSNRFATEAEYQAQGEALYAALPRWNP